MELLAEQNNLCFYCGIKVYEKSDDNKTLATIDHIKARKDGGTHDRDNLVVACYPCNFAKDNLPASAIKRKVRRKLKFVIPNDTIEPERWREMKKTIKINPELFDL